MVKEGMKALQNTGTLGVFFMDTYILCCLLFVFVKVSFTLGCSGGWVGGGVGVEGPNRTSFIPHSFKANTGRLNDC